MLQLVDRLCGRWCLTRDDEYSACQPDRLRELAEACEWKVRANVAGHRGITSDTAWRLVEDKSVNVRKELADNPDIPIEVLKKLAVDGHRTVRLSVARRYPDIPIEVLGVISEDPDPGVRQSLAYRYDLPIKFLEKLASDSDPEVRRAIAEHESAPLQTLLGLASDPDPGVRHRVAESEGLSPDTLTRLAEDSDSEVRQSLAYRYDLPIKSLEKLASDSDPEVRRAIAEHESAPLQTRLGLASDPDPGVREVIAMREDTFADILDILSTEDNARTRRCVAQHENTLPDTLARLASDSDPKVREWVAWNRRTSDEVAAKLATDPDPRVRLAAVRHRVFSNEIMAALACDSVFEVRKAVVRHRTANLPPEVLDKLAEESNMDVQRWVTEHAGISADTLARLAEHENPRVRWRVAEHANCPLEILTRLATDPSSSVRKRSHLELGRRGENIPPPHSQKPAHSPAAQREVGYSHANGVRVPTMEDAERAAAVLPGTVFVGGSVARGEARIDSDVDFLCIVDRDAKTGISMHDEALESEIKAMLGLPVDVLLVDWPRWISYTKAAASIESVFLKEGIMLKWVPPGPDVRWSDALPAEQVRRTASKWTLNALDEALSGILRGVRPGPFRDESIALKESDPEKFWKMWGRRMELANFYSHRLVDRTLEMLCFATETPRRSILVLFDMLYDLDRFPIPTRSVLAEQLGTVDLEWLRNWQKPFAYLVSDVAGRKYTRMSGMPYDVGVATYVRFAVNLFSEALRHASDADRSTYGRLHVAVGKIREQLAQLRDAISDSRWVYAFGTPPKEWPRPWESA